MSKGGCILLFKSTSEIKFMKDKEIVEAIQDLWDRHGTAEIVVTEKELGKLINILMGLYTEALARKKDDLIIVQFLTQASVNSAYIRQIKTTRIHTLLKGSVTVPAEDYYKPSSEEITDRILDFENELCDILDAIVEGSAS